jgi:hypothetical protein
VHALNYYQRFTVNINSKVGDLKNRNTLLQQLSKNLIESKNDKFWRKFKISCHINQQKPYSKRVSLRFFVALNYLKRDSNGIIMVKLPRVRGLTIKSKQHTVYCNIGNIGKF